MGSTPASCPVHPSAQHLITNDSAFLGVSLGSACIFPYRLRSGCRTYWA
jgi:hypothetical protein